MAKAAITFDTVREIALALPEVEESTSWRSPSLKVRGKMFACMASHKSADPNTLVVCVDFLERDVLIAAEPETYYVKPHYLNHACVLVRLSRVKKSALRELLATAHEFIARKSRKKR